VGQLREPLGCRSEGGKRSIIFAVGGLSFGRTCRCTVASHSRGHHAVHNRAPLWIPRLIFEPFRQWRAPFLFRRERLLVSQPPTPRGVAVAGDIKERAVFHFRSEPYFCFERAPLARAKGPQGAEKDQCARNDRWPRTGPRMGSGNRLKGNFARKTFYPPVKVHFPV
jgi:hypothetical protein